MISPERLDLLQRQWVRLLEGFGVSPAEAYPSFDRLVAAYSEPHRYYHTLEHLAEMFRVVGRLGLSDPAPVCLAVWYHDAVYDTRVKDNEGRSADLAVRELTALRLPAEVVGKVRTLVLATDHVNPPPAINGQVAVLLDADLAILGASPERYRRYADDIRKEYDWVPEEAYRAGREQVLLRFLAMPYIYRTGPMIAEGEAAARRNLRAEIDHLRRQSAD